MRDDEDQYIQAWLDSPVPPNLKKKYIEDLIENEDYTTSITVRFDTEDELDRFLAMYRKDISYSTGRERDGTFFAEVWKKHPSEIADERW